MVICKGSDIVSHINKYENKLQTSFFKEWDLNKYPYIFLFPNGEFMTYGYNTGALQIGPTCANFKECKQIAIKVCELTGIKKIRTTTYRNWRAYLRMSGGTVVKKIMNPMGLPEYTFELEV
jgi:hypothetical protein